eukprot:symbB.v1.2.007374.t1/scaffold449.1/size202926/4
MKEGDHIAALEMLPEEYRDVAFVLRAKHSAHISPRPLLLWLRELCDQLFDPDLATNSAGKDKMDKISIIRRFHRNTEEELHTLFSKFDFLLMFRENFVTSQFRWMLETVIFVYVVLYPWCVCNESNLVLGATTVGMACVFYGLNALTEQLEDPVHHQTQGFDLRSTFINLFAELDRDEAMREYCRCFLEDQKKVRIQASEELHNKFEDVFRPRQRQVYCDMFNEAAVGYAISLTRDPRRKAAMRPSMAAWIMMTALPLVMASRLSRKGRIECPGMGGTCHCNCKMPQQMPMAMAMPPPGMAIGLPPPPPTAGVVPPLPPPAAPLVPPPPPPDPLPVQPLVSLAPLPEISHLGVEDIPKLTTAPPPPPVMSEEDATKAMLKWLTPGELDARQQQLENLKKMQKSTREQMAKAMTAAGTSMADHAMQHQIMKHQMAAAAAAAAFAGAPAPAPAPAAKPGDGKMDKIVDDVEMNDAKARVRAFVEIASEVTALRHLRGEREAMREGEGCDCD